MGLRRVEDGGPLTLVARFPGRGLFATRPLEGFPVWADELGAEHSIRPELRGRAMVWPVRDTDPVALPVKTEEWIFWTVLPAKEQT